MLQDLRHARDILRLAGMFAAMILLPALILSGLAITSIGSAELQFDAWGIEAVPGKVAADHTYAMPISVGGQGQPERVSAVFYLGLRDEAFDAETQRMLEALGY